MSECMKPLALFLALMMVSGVVWAQNCDYACLETNFQSYTRVDSCSQCRNANSLEQLVTILSEKAKV
jgi:hypothetical protein